jgi:exodeoxyribonuclease V beta subunit
LQYYIYTVALVRFLKSRVRDFNYGSHFGGVIYLFLRGVDIELQSSGVYFDKPDEDIVKKIESLIRGSI